jgi:HD-like signal output (HDOD) protein
MNEPARSGAGADTPLGRLLRRIEAESDFPALSESVSAINRIAASDRESVSQLSNAILKDFALTSKLLKLANAAFYNRAGGGGISTVSRAVVILGFDAVRSIALSLILFDNLQNGAQIQQLKEEFFKVLYAALLARELVEKAGVHDAEEAFIGAMLHHLGRMLVLFYFPAEMAAVRERMASRGITEALAATEVLGASPEQLGIAVARNWGFPERLVQSMKHLPPGRIRRSANDVERLRILAGFASALCEGVTAAPEDGHHAAMARLLERFRDSIPLTAEQIGTVMSTALAELSNFAQAVNVDLARSTFAAQAAQWAGLPSPAAAPDAGMSQQATAAQDALDAAVLHEPVPPRCATDEGPPHTPEAVQARLASGLQDVGNSLIDDNVSLNDILRMILETMYTGMGFEHVILCIRDAGRNTMRGRFGFGEGAQTLARAFDFPLAGTPDVFLVALQNNADILIDDIDSPNIASRIPAWLRRQVPARTFVLFPILVKGKPIGLIYADRGQAGDIVIPEKELSLLKSLRNQAVLALRQSM